MASFVIVFGISQKHFLGAIWMKRKIRNVKGLFGQFYDQLKGLFDQFLCLVKGFVWAVLWAFYMPNFSLRVKCVIA